MTNKAREVVVVDGVRTPMGKIGGQLARVRPDDMAGYVLAALLKRSGLEGRRVDEVVLGCANQAGEDNRNVARMAALLAGLPQEVPAHTVNRLCASGLDAVSGAARLILSGEADVVLAGGVESMSRAPWALPKAEAAFPFGNLTAYDTALGWRFPNPRLQALFPLYSMGETAENICEKYKIPREEQDALALESHKRALKAREASAREEIVPIALPQKKGTLLAEKDEGPREETSLEKLSALAPVFREGGSVTAGNSSTLSDGAAAVLLAERSKAEALGLKPVLRWSGSAAAGIDPSFMGLGPVLAVRRLLERLGLKIEDFDLVEINEAFAVQVLACVRELKVPLERLNVNGGAIALGHPLGMSGARLVVTLLHEMRRRGARRGLASLCVGVGQGAAAAFELLDGKAPSPEPAAAAGTQKPHLLIVDDDELLAYGLRDHFLKLGCEVAVALDPIQAASELQRFRPHLVLLDVEMPGGGGIEFYQRLRATPFGAQLPILFVTGHPHRVQHILNPWTAILKKPVELAQLDRSVREMLYKRPS